MIRKAVLTIALVAFTVSQAFAFKEPPRLVVGLTVGHVTAVGGGGFSLLFNNPLYIGGTMVML